MSYFSHEGPLCFWGFLCKWKDGVNCIKKKKEIQVVFGMVAPNGGQLSRGLFENVAPVCSSWNSWYVCCYDNGFSLVDDVDIWSVHSHWGLMFQPLNVIPNLIELTGFYLKLKNGIHSRRQYIFLCKGQGGTLSLRELGLGSCLPTTTLPQFPLL